MRIGHSLALAALLSLVTADWARADVQIAIRDGRVTLNATSATVREILAAWAKAGQTKIVNAERVAGAPVDLQLQDVPEEQALEIILRSVSGYLAAPRADTIENASRFDRIFVMPTSTPPPTVPAPQPAFPQPQLSPAAQPQLPAGDDDDDDPAPGAVPNPRGPLFTFPPPGIAPQAGTPPPPATPVNGQVPGQVPGRAPAGATVPGMIVQPPQQPGQGQPGVPPAQREP